MPRKFYCSGWVIHFPDSMLVFMDQSSIPELTEYSHLIKKEKKEYLALCWTGQMALETPTQVKQKLKIDFNDDMLTFKLGRKKCKYLLSDFKGKAILIKMKE